MVVSAERRSEWVVVERGKRKEERGKRDKF
jgi:hypothetical protein